MPFQMQQEILTGYTEESGVTEIIVPEEVKAIGNECFLDCRKIVSVILPDSLTEIPYRAFKNCTSLNRIYIPETVTRIGEGAFSGCESLKELLLPPNLESVGEYAFYGSERLMNFRLSNGVFRVRMRDIYQNQQDTSLLKKFLCEKHSAQKRNLFSCTEDAKYKSAMACYLLISGQADEEVRRYARKNITRTAKFYMDNQETEGLQELLSTGFITKSNIGKLLEYAIASRYHESYLLLLEYKDRHIGFQNPADKLKLS
ncbi:MAG: leucine-rich repeat domain-containing protein [Oscillospiraceae bacterium]|nr:leucine-rich repeat domain-containing protein [Oscillospiraceae bacterium]